MAHFLAVLTPKSLELGDDHKLHKHVQAQELQAELEGLLGPLQAPTDPPTDEGGSHAAARVIQTKEGGGLVACGDASEVCTADIGDRIAVFQGTLKNLQQLVQKHGCPPGSEADKVNAAEMVLHLYDSMGLAVLTQLSGRFSLCMYDAKQMRVLAARDGSGSVPLLQARTSRDSLVISSNPALLTCCHDTLEFAPGFFKYGWHAEPRLFTPADTNPSHHGPVRRSIDHHSAGSSRTGSRRTSLDTHAAGKHVHGTPGSAPRHTPHSALRRTSTDNGHHLTFSSPSRDTPNGSRARHSHDNGGPRITTRSSKGSDDSHAHPVNTTHGFKPSKSGGKSKVDSPRDTPSRSPLPAIPLARTSAGTDTTTSAADLLHPMAHLNVHAKAFVPTPAATPSLNC